MGFVVAYSKSTGAQHWVPEEWFDEGNEILVRDLTQDAPDGAGVPGDEQGPPPERPDRDDKSWTISRLREYAGDNSIALGDASKRDDIFDVIERVQAEPDNPAKTAIGVAHGGPGGETATQDADASDQVTTPTTTPATGENQE